MKFWRGEGQEAFAFSACPSRLKGLAMPLARYQKGAEEVISLIQHPFPNT